MRSENFPISVLLHVLLCRLPAILNERLFGNCNFVHNQMECSLPFVELGGERLNLDPLLPEGRSYLSKQPRTVGNLK